MIKNKKDLADRCMDLSVKIIKGKIKSDIQLRKELLKGLSKEEIIKCAEQFILEKTMEIVIKTDRKPNDIMIA